MRVSVEFSVQIQRAADKRVELRVAAGGASLQKMRWRWASRRLRDDADVLCHLLHAHLAVAGQEVGAFGSAHRLAALAKRLGVANEKVGELRLVTGAGGARGKEPAC